MEWVWTNARSYTIYIKEAQAEAQSYLYLLLLFGVLLSLALPCLILDCIVLYCIVLYCILLFLSWAINFIGFVMSRNAHAPCSFLLFLHVFIATICDTFFVRLWRGVLLQKLCWLKWLWAAGMLCGEKKKQAIHTLVFVIWIRKHVSSETRWLVGWRWWSHFQLQNDKRHMDCAMCMAPCRW